MLNTVEHERHAPMAVLVAFARALRDELTENAPSSTRDLLSRAERGNLEDQEVRTVVDEFRALL